MTCESMTGSCLRMTFADWRRSLRVSPHHGREMNELAVKNGCAFKLLLLLLAVILCLVIVADTCAEVPKKSVTQWSWKKHGPPVIEPGMSGEHDQVFARAGHVIETETRSYPMYYVGRSAEGRQSICMATAPINQPTACRPETT